MSLSQPDRNQIRAGIHDARKAWQELADQDVMVVTTIVRVEILITPNGTEIRNVHQSALPLRIRDIVQTRDDLREVRIACFEPGSGLPGTFIWGTRHTVWRKGA